MPKEWEPDNIPGFILAAWIAPKAARNTVINLRLAIANELRTQKLYDSWTIVRLKM